MLSHAIYDRSFLMPLGVFDRTLRFLSEEGRVYFRARNKKAVSKQLHEIRELYRWYGFVPYQYFKHQLYDKEFSGDVKDFLPPELVHRYRNKVNPRECWVNVVNKSKFSSVMRAAGLPVVQDLFLVDRNLGILDLDRNPLTFSEFIELLHEKDLHAVFVKPESGGQGKGAHRCEVAASGLVVNGIVMDERAFTDCLFSNNTFPRYVVQPVIIQHPVLQALNSASVNTVRIDTLILGEAVYHNGAMLRVGRGVSCTDNFHDGGFAIGINLETGCVGDVGIQSAEFGKTRVKSHPESGILFSSITVPFWDEIKVTTKQAALAMLPLKSLGWDIAVTLKGPLIIESNQDYGISSLQECSGGLRHTPLGQEIEKGLRCSR